MMYASLWYHCIHVLVCHDICILNITCIMYMMYDNDMTVIACHVHNTHVYMHVHVGFSVLIMVVYVCVTDNLFMCL